MTINRKLYFLGFAIYLFSFFLPAIPILNEPVRGYFCAIWIFGSLFKYRGAPDYFFTVFANLANFLTLLVFILQFKCPITKLIIFQAIAFLSALYWLVLDLVQGGDLSSMFIGYWNWLFGILVMLTVMVGSFIGEKKTIMSSQPVNSADPKGRAAD